MKYANLFSCLALTILLAGCGGGSSPTKSITPPPAAPTLSSLAVSPSNFSLIMGTTQQYNAIGTYSDATTGDLTTGVVWSSSAPAVATIDNSGLATPVANGTAQITATLGSISKSTTLTVTSPTLVSLAVSPVNPSVIVGTSGQFLATGTFSDASTRSMTTTATWGSSDPAVATISNSIGTNGKTSTLSVGSSVISASFGTVSAFTTLTVTAVPAPGINTMPVTVNGSLCSANSYPNKPCVSVTICSPGTATCQTIDDILLDTGSTGLRLFKQVITVPLTQTSVGGSQLATCVQFADGSADWGPVKLADVVLGGEPAVTVPIHVIDAAFGTVPSFCGVPETTPSAAGFNGILGVGLFVEDCGSSLCDRNSHRELLHLQRFQLQR